MKLVLVDYTNYKKAIEIQKAIFPKEDGTLCILASLDRDLFMKKTGMYYDDDDVKFYLAYDNDEIIGITGLYRFDPESAWLAFFGVLKEKRRNHYGEEILKESIKLAKQKKFKTLRLYTDITDNYEATKLYEKLGFTSEKYLAEELSYDCYIYSKSLCNEEVKPWNNKNLGLTYQTELEQVSKERINEILKLYE